MNEQRRVLEQSLDAIMPQTTLMSYFTQPRQQPPLQPPAIPQAINTEQLSKSCVDESSIATQTLPAFGSDISEPPSDPVSVSESDDDLVDTACSRSEASKEPTFVITGVEKDHLKPLQRLTSVLLPVKYPDSLFTGSVDDPIPASFSRVALSESQPVGWMRCRLDPFPEPTVPPTITKPIYNRLYIQALCLLAPFRGQGIATALLDAILDAALLQQHDVEYVYAHVWETNESALVWYERRAFHRVMLVEGYYRKLKPNGAWIMKRDLR